MLALVRETSELATWVQVRWVCDLLQQLLACGCRSHELPGT